MTLKKSRHPMLRPISGGARNDAWTNSIHTCTLSNIPTFVTEQVLDSCRFHQLTCFWRDKILISSKSSFLESNSIKPLLQSFPKIHPNLEI